MAFHKILVTLDGSPLSETALKYAEKIAAPNAHITLLTVMEEDWEASLLMAGAIGTPVPFPRDPRRANDGHAIAATYDYLKNIVLGIHRRDLKITTEVHTGSVVTSVLAVAEQGYDLIVMATHGRTGLGKVFMGSVTTDVLPKAPCPVLVVPPERKEPKKNE